MILESGDITLRPLERTDREPMAELLNNKKVWDNLRDLIPFPYSTRDAALFISQTHKNRFYITFGIAYQGSFAGIIGLIPKEDVYRNSMELGYWLGEPYWNKGIVTEAVRLICDYAFENLTINRIFSEVFEYNPASMKVLEKTGFKKEGVARKAILKNEQLWDNHLYSLLKDDLKS